MSISVEKLSEVGNLWEKHGKRRVYINDLPAHYGLSVQYYNTGNVSSASLDGERISNSAARRLLGRLYGKLWYDLNADKWAYRDLDDDCAAVIIEELNKKLAGGVS